MERRRWRTYRHLGAAARYELHLLVAIVARAGAGEVLQVGHYLAAARCPPGTAPRRPADLAHPSEIEK